MISAMNIQLSINSTTYQKNETTVEVLERTCDYGNNPLTFEMLSNELTFKYKRFKASKGGIRK